MTCGLAAQRIGILHPIVALEVGAADFAAHHELTQGAGDFDLSRLAA